MPSDFAEVLSSAETGAGSDRKWGFPSVVRDMPKRRSIPDIVDSHFNDASLFALAGSLDLSKIDAILRSEQDLSTATANLDGLWRTSSNVAQMNNMPTIYQQLSTPDDCVNEMDLNFWAQSDNSVGGTVPQLGLPSDASPQWWDDSTAFLFSDGGLAVGPSDQNSNTTTGVTDVPQTPKQPEQLCNGDSPDGSSSKSSTPPHSERDSHTTVIKAFVDNSAHGTAMNDHGTVMNSFVPYNNCNSNNISNNNNNNPSPIPRTHSAPPTHEPQRQQQERSLVPPRRLHSADEPIGTRAGKSALSGIGEDSEDVFDVILAPKEERWNENHHKNNNDRKSTSPHRNNHHRQQGKEAEEQVYQDDFEDFEYEDDWETLTEEEEEELCDMVGMLQRQLEAPPRPPSGAVGLATPVPSKSSSHPPSTPLLEPNAKEIYSRKAIALQEKCERELGKSLFQRVYDYIWDKRVQKRTPRGNHMSAEDMDRAFEEEEREIYEGVVKLAAGDNKKLSSCFLVDQLIFWQRTAQGW